MLFFFALKGPTLAGVLEWLLQEVRSTGLPFVLGEWIDAGGFSIRRGVCWGRELKVQSGP
jgi:hypothetical protein